MHSLSTARRHTAPHHDYAPAPSAHARNRHRPTRALRALSASSAAVLGLLLLAAPSTARAGQATIDALNNRIRAGGDMLDYTIQDVCVDGNDTPIAGDPASCPSHRNLYIGERVPYVVTDFDRNNGNYTYQGLWSYPLPGSDNLLKVMTTKSNAGNFNASFAFSFDKWRDGYDLIDLNGGYISGIRTSDGGCLDQKISFSNSQRRNGWIFFPDAGGSSALTHSIVLNRLDPQRPAGCAATSSGSSARDVWNTPVNVAYETGKVLSTIVTYHYATANFSVTNNALERFFFTREYGFTRWEAWLPLSRCYSDFASDPSRCDPAGGMLSGRCGATAPHPGIEVWGNQQWVRVDCRDSTNYVALATPVLPFDTYMARSNGLVDVDTPSVLNPPPVLGSWSGNGAGSYHVRGNANGTGWETIANGIPGILTYGPYVTGIAAGPREAVFSLKVDNNSADNSPVIDIDVYRNSTGTLFASATITRQQFLKANMLQTFVLPFWFDGSGELEFRVNVRGNSYVYHAKSYVR